MKNYLKIMLLIAFVFCSGCATYFGYDGPYEGKVVDAETKQPLEGVVVLGAWYKRQLTVAGSTSSFYDSVEVLTDQNGVFKISGQGLLLFSSLDEMDVTIFKAGYEMRGGGSWSGFKTRTGGRNIQWDGSKPTIMLKKLSYEERKKRRWSTPSLKPDRQKLFTTEMNKELRELGHVTYPEK